MQARQRLNILSNATKALSGPLASKTAHAKLQKALDRLWSVPKVAQASREQQPDRATCIDLTDGADVTTADPPGSQRLDEVHDRPSSSRRSGFTSTLR